MNTSSTSGLPVRPLASLVSESWQVLFRSTSRNITPFESGDPARLHADDDAVRRATIERLLPQWLVQPAWRGFALSTCVALFVGLVDTITDREFQLVPLYLVPVTLAAWIVGRRAGIGVAVISAGVWLTSDLGGGGINQHPVAPFLNAIGLAVVFTTVAVLTSRMKHWTSALEKAVKNRTAALHDEMNQHQRAEEARIRSERLAIVGTMSAQLAHEVRNPLGALTLNLQLLETELASPGTTAPDLTEQRLLITEMQSEVRRIGQVVDGCIGLVRHPDTRRQAVKINDFIDRKLKLTQGTLAEASVVLARTFDTSLDTVLTDGDKIWQALINLINNAKEAMTAGGLIHLETRKRDDSWQIILTDTGCGMDAETRAGLYTPFYTNKPNGTGLGLMLVQEIVKELGGGIDCDSAPGMGTVFTLTFPITTSSNNLELNSP